MARIAGQQNQARPLAGAGGFTAEVDATARLERTAARGGSDRGVETDRRRFYFGPLRSGQLAGRRSLRARVAAIVALSIRANLEGRNFAQIEAALRREDHPRNPFPRWLRSRAFSVAGLEDQLGDPGLIQLAQAGRDHPLVLRFRRAGERKLETKLTRK